VSLRSEVGTLALDLAGGVIGETLSDDKKAQAVVDRFLAELEESALRQAQEPEVTK
jgi:F-type H+-transporting ATPase subunit b